MTHTRRRPTSWIVGLALAVASTLVFGGMATAATLHIPADFSTIQACLDGAMPGDECVVAPGIYNELIDFNGKAITLRPTFPICRLRRRSSYRIPS